MYGGDEFNEMNLCRSYTVDNIFNEAMTRAMSTTAGWRGPNHI